MKLDDYEEDILEKYENSELNSIVPDKEELEELSVMARDTLNKNRRVNIRVSNHDLQAIQRKAIQEGLPYQTLISSLIHKYTTGLLIYKEQIR